jgi:anti-sigma B factor antagonist
MSVDRMAFTDSPVGFGSPVLSLTTRTEGPVTVLQAVGDLDMDTARLLLHRVDDLAVGHGPLLLALELDRLEFLDAAGVTALLRIRDALADGGGHLTLRRPSVQACLVLTVTGAIEFFDVMDADGDS